MQDGASGGVYVVVGWDERYETADTRRMRKMRYVKQSTDLASDALMDILDGADGHAVYGVWRLLVALAAHARPRGSLVQDTGAPHTVETIARRLRAEPALIAASLDRLKSVGWLDLRDSAGRSTGNFCESTENFCESTENFCDFTEKSCLTKRNVTKLNETERNGAGPPPDATGRLGDSSAEAAPSPRSSVESARKSSRIVSSGSSPDADAQREYELCVRRIFFGVADTPLLRRIIRLALPLDELRAIREDYESAPGPTRSTSSAYLLGIFRERGYLTKGNDK